MKDSFKTEEAYMKYRNRFNKLRRLRRAKMKLFALEYLGGQCVKCGHDEDLEFDHILGDREDNEHCISVMINNLSNSSESYDILIKELKKCQLLCKPCHWEKTKNDFNQGIYIHGTTTSYRKNKCRCEECVHAHSSYLKEYRRKRLERLR